MAIYIGKSKVKDIYLEDKKVKQIYLGTKLTYQAGTWKKVWNGREILDNNKDFFSFTPGESCLRNFGLKNNVPTQVSATLMIMNIGWCTTEPMEFDYLNASTTGNHNISNIPWRCNILENPDVSYPTLSKLMLSHEGTGLRGYMWGELDWMMFSVEINEIWQKI